VASASPSKLPRAGDWHTGHFAQANKGTLPLLLPPRQDKDLLAAEALESSSSIADSKLAAIKSYRKALGLYYKCGVLNGPRIINVLLRFCWPLKLFGTLLGFRCGFRSR
jgi:hypothetical protein